MYATIRRYTLKSGTTQKAIDEFKSRIENTFVPTLQDIRGLHCYYAAVAGTKELVTVSIFDDKNGTTESIRRAAEFVKKDPFKDQLSTPEIFEGEIVVSKESLVGAR
jgi:hypothetical protein